MADVRELSVAFKALADPTRVRMVSLLLAAGPEGLCVCDIVVNFPLGQPTISYHLRLLKESGLVSATKKGLWVHYRANPDRLSALGISLPVSPQAVSRSACCDDIISE
ncbi:MAG: helix-turn-helix transcriptional regulator [Chloroflexi bacterium]|nr:helix-turn-helix transcriptional regulator [Chloroflexota bacterium]